MLKKLQELVSGAFFRESQEIVVAQNEQRVALQLTRETVLPLIDVISKIDSARDLFNYQHQLDVGVLAEMIALELRYTPDNALGVRIAGVVHDIGKTLIPLPITWKPGKLTPQELKIMQAHTTLGYELFANLNLPWNIKEVCLYHHERNDGSGYPYGMRGANIPMDAQIVAVADVIHAMMDNRPYRSKLSQEYVLDFVLQEAKAGKLSVDAAEAAARILTDGRCVINERNLWKENSDKLHYVSDVLRTINKA